MKQTPFIILVMGFALGAFYLAGLIRGGDDVALESEKLAVVDETLPAEQERAFIAPDFLKRDFPNTDFSDVDPMLKRIMSGGPAKDGIPAIDAPKFVPVNSFEYGDDTQAIVLQSASTTKVYPYNILTWHEIVNDTFEGRPVAITFCPLCGSAIVYDRRLPGGESTFGVSGALIESNMVMYDRHTESLWQQSTGKGLAGVYKDEQLKLVPFQLLTIGEVKELYPNAELLSDATGYPRDYGNNPYAGYNEDQNRFVFNISRFDGTFDPKEIMVVFKVNDVPVATPWLEIEEGATITASVAGEQLTLLKQDGELTIENEFGETYPFYFEMWFSFAIQHAEDGEVI